MLFMGLLFVKNKSHRVSDENGQYCEIETVIDSSDCADKLYDHYHETDFNKSDWAIVRSIDLKRVLLRILKSDQVTITRVALDNDDFKLKKKSCKYKNQLIVMGQDDSTYISYKNKKYYFGYDFDINELMHRIKQEQLFDMSDFLEICNELKIKIDWSRLSIDVVDVDRVTSERRKLRK